MDPSNSAHDVHGGLPLVLALASTLLALQGCDKAPPVAPREAPPPAAKPVAPAPPVQSKRTPDEILADSVRSALADQPGIAKFAIDVRVTRGRVELFGTVDSNGSRDRVVKAARDAANGAEVVSHLVLVAGS